MLPGHLFEDSESLIRLTNYAPGGVIYAPPSDILLEVGLVGASDSVDFGHVSVNPLTLALEPVAVACVLFEWEESAGHGRFVGWRGSD